MGGSASEARRSMDAPTGPPIHPCQRSHASRPRVRPRRSAPVPVVTGRAGVRLHHEKMRLNRVVSVVTGGAASERVGVLADVVVAGEAERISSLPHWTRIPAVLVRVADGAVVSGVRRMHREGLRPERERAPRASVLPDRRPRRRRQNRDQEPSGAHRIPASCRHARLNEAPCPRGPPADGARASCPGLVLARRWPRTATANPGRPTPGRRAPCPGGRGRSRERGEALPSG